MIAVVEVAGRQYRVAQNDTIVVPTLHEKPGTKLQFQRVLLLSDEKGTAVGNPVVQGAKVEATVVGNLRGDKVTVFKKKKRKGYRLKRGHRQDYTEVTITNIAK
ncbi:MAG TPA: 50S ribosomal protein L21 [Bacteroidota bacterium]|nr:50S ribosomal protein L21 [Bacteroidota bacterium]